MLTRLVSPPAAFDVRAPHRSWRPLRRLRTYPMPRYDDRGPTDVELSSNRARGAILAFCANPVNHTPGRIPGRFSLGCPVPRLKNVSIDIYEDRRATLMLTRTHNAMYTVHHARRTAQPRHSKPKRPGSTGAGCCCAEAESDTSKMMVRCCPASSPCPGASAP